MTAANSASNRNFLKARSRVIEKLLAAYHVDRVSAVVDAMHDQALELDYTDQIFKAIGDIDVADPHKLSGVAAALATVTASVDFEDEVLDIEEDSIFCELVHCLAFHCQCVLNDAAGELVAQMFGEEMLDEFEKRLSNETAELESAYHRRTKRLLASRKAKEP